MFSMHMGIWQIMGINFYDLLFIQWIFYDWSPVVRWVGRKLDAKRGTITVLYDGNCPLCQRTIRTIRPMDLLHRLNVVDFRTADLPRLAASHGVELDPARLDREMIVIKSGRTYGGAKGARVIAGALPALWIVWPFLALPGLSQIASAVYRTVARNRMSLLKCDPSGACAIDYAGRTDVAPAVDYAAPSTLSGEAAPIAASSRSPIVRAAWLRRMAPGLGVATMFLCMFGWWTTKHEWYPITCMQMFTWYAADEQGNPTSVVHYYRAYVFYEDGTQSLAKFDKMGGGIARYQNTLAAPFLPKVPQEYRDKARRDCVDLMRRSAEWWNANAAMPGKRIVRMETHHRQWDFVKERDDYGKWGKTVEAITVEIEPRAPDAHTLATNTPARGS
jgi:predicted DCC family thiol-disulfide oxidoreductase YuxK